MHRSRYQKSIKDPSQARILKPGGNNKKLGNKVTKGRFKGYKLFSLTLEERVTCPTTCHHWEDCYGNNMPFAHRYKHGHELEKKLQQEVPELCGRYPAGVLIRLHVLGDFYSVPYVNLWETLLNNNPNLACYGYTARYYDSIGAAIARLGSIHSDRFVMRYSTNPRMSKPKLLYASGEAFEGDSFICPEQESKVTSCAACAACWQTPKTVRFLTH